MSESISTIADFYRVAQDRDFARKNQLRVLSIDTGAGFSTSFKPDDLVYVQTLMLPNREISISQASFMGLDFQIPGNAKYPGSNNYSLTFFADQKLDLWNKINDWTREVFDDEDSTGNYFTPKASSRITLIPIDNKLNPLFKMALIGITPKSVSELSYEISDAGTLHTFTFSCSYHFWQKESI